MAGRPKKEYTPVESISGLKDIIAADNSLTESQKILLTEMAMDFDTVNKIANAKMKPLTN